MSSKRRLRNTASIPSGPIHGRCERGAAAIRGGYMAVTEIKVPDIGDFKDVPVIEVLVKAGDQVKVEDALITLESDKATMDVPAPAAGTVKEMKVKVGDKLSEGNVILTLESSSAEAPKAAAAPARSAPSTPASAAPRPAAPGPAASIDSESFKKAHASPSVRAFARELGVDLSKIRGSGPKERILREDVQKYVKEAMSGAASVSAASAAGGAALG